MNPISLSDLKKVYALNDLPDDQLQWISDHSLYVEYNDGEVVMKTGEEAVYMMFILDGVLSFYMDKNGTLVHYFDFSNDETTGGVTGLLPYSRMKNSPGTSIAVGKLRGLRMHKEHFPELEKLNPDFIQRLIGYMTERARSFATTQLQQEKVSALGKLAAGIAHELNNPASAIDRISVELEKRLKRNYRLTENMLTSKISADRIENIRMLVEEIENNQSSKKKLTAMQRMEREDAITSWLEQQGLLGNHMIGETFADSGYNEKDLEKIKELVGNEAFIQVLHWLENLLSSQRIMRDLHEASSRISGLVGAIKSHVHMDRTYELQSTDLHNNIETTLTLLGYKISEKKITVKKNFCDNMPEIPAYVSELNQVWTNIIDNAIYAMSQKGELIIETSCNEKNVNVKIIDDGIGIPKEIVSRIFDPFFTTKKVGDGTGIGLDLVNRIIKKHKGDIKVNSKPGRTEFLICIPVTQELNK
jgi:signal transduction histidine kinase